MRNINKILYRVYQKQGNYKNARYILFENTCYIDIINTHLDYMYIPIIETVQSKLFIINNIKDFYGIY